MVTSMVANTARDPKKHRKPYQPADFMPEPSTEEKQPQTWEGLKEKATAVFRALGGKVT